MVRQHGYILLPVVLLITLVAAVAFMINNESALDSGITGSKAEVKQVEYVAQAGLQHALWANNNSGCAGDLAMTTVPFGQAGVNNYTATVTTPGGSTTTYADLAADQDAWFRSDNITNNNGGTATYHLRMESGNLEYAMVRFDLSTLPAGSQVNSAIARFYVSPTKGHPEGPVTVHRVTADWTEAGATWETMSDKFDSTVLAVIPAQPDSGGNWVEINLTAQVQAWVNAGEANYGIMLIPTGEGTHGEYVSREGAANQQPQLDVIVGTGPATPATITATGTLTGNPSPANDITRTLTRSIVPVYQPPSYLLLQPGAALGKDAYIWKWNKTTNYGTDDETWVSTGNTHESASLFQFNVEAIPAGARILDATLSLYHRSGNDSNVPVTAHRITNGWREDAVTWNDRKTGKAWDTAGGDSDAAIVATTSVGPASGIRYQWDIASLVQGWVNGTYNNDGVVLRTVEPGTLGERFDTSDHADPTRHPRLSISYNCECGSSCLAPQGSGNVLLVVVNPSTLVPDDAFKKVLFESWGYTVNVISESANQTAFDSGATLNDVVYVSSTVNANNLGSKLVHLPIGVVSEDGDYNPDLGFATGAAWTVDSAVNVIDASHYITALFPTGPLDIYSVGMEQLTVSGTTAAGLQTLADTGGAGSLVVLDTGAALGGGATGENAAGPRVMLPLGRNGNFNWDYLNSNGRLLVQRALQWGIGIDTGTLPLKPIAHWKLDETSGTTAVDSQGGHNGTVTPGPAWTPGQIDGGLDFDGVDDEIIVPHNTALSLTEAFTFTAWVKADSYGISTDYQAVLTKGNSFVHNYWFGVIGTEVALDFRVGGSWHKHATTGAGLTAGNWYHLVASFDNVTDSVRLYVDGVEAFNGVMSVTPEVNTADIRIGNSAFTGEDWPGVLDDVRIYDEALAASDIAELAQRDVSPPMNVLLIVGNLTLSSKDVGYKALIESWGHTVSLLDDGASQTDYNTAMDAADVILATGSASGPSMLDKATNTTTGLVNEVNGKIDNFGFSSSTSSTANFDTFSMTSATHYITEPFAGNPVTVFTSSLTNPVPGGTLAPDLSNVGEVSGTPSLVTLDAGATRYDSNPSQGRRAHLPFTSAETTDMTADGKTILQRSLEWAAGAGAGSGGGGGGGGASCDGTFRDEFNAVSFSNNDGTLNWAGDWLEVGESDGPGSNDVRIRDDNGAYQLWLRDNQNGGEGAEREADLSGATAAMLSFDYRRSSLDSASDYVKLEISPNGTAGPWTELARFQGSATDSAYQSFSQDISGYISANTRVRLITSPTMGNLDLVIFDNIEIACSP